MLGYNFHAVICPCRIITQRSSDDSVSIYIGLSPHEVKECIIRTRLNLALTAINLSQKKTFFFPEGYGEYTSWYQDLGFVAKFGVETSSLGSQGEKPQDDLYSIAKNTASLLQNLSVNPLGATIRLMLGVECVRRLSILIKESSN